MGAPYQCLPCHTTRPIPPGAPSTITLPMLTTAGDQTKNQVFLHVEPLPNLTGSCARGANPFGVFGLVRGPLTIAYHSPDLAPPPFYYTITNHYQPRS